VYAIRHYLGAFLVSLGGVDVITFSGGIGENSCEIRSAVLKGLSAFGIELDETKNQSIAGEGTISAESSVVRVMVIPANEETIVARETAAIVSQLQAATSNAVQPAILAESVQG
jgi:acetate kinase